MAQRLALPSPPQRPSLRNDESGAVAIEYTMLLIFVALPVAAALAAAGVIMLDEFRLARDLVLLPVP